jgi:hypothetical protein
MKTNMGGTDKIARIIVAFLLVILYFKGIVTGVLGIILLVVAGVFIITSLIGFCPLYTLFGYSTCKTKDK